MAMNTSQRRRASRLRRHARVRRHVSGTSERPRLAVYRSSRHIYAQVIDDDAGRTLVAASTRDRGVGASGSKTEQAKAVGTAIAARAKDVGIDAVVFDRGGYRYHGRVRALADAAREAGLSF